MSYSDYKSMYTQLIKAGMTKNGACGLLGNIHAESGGKSNNLQQTYEKKLGYTDDTYTAAVDNGTYTNFVHDSAGYGLCQWTYYSRKQNLLNYAKGAKASIGSESMQIEFLLHELKTSYKSVFNVLCDSAKTLKQCSDVVLTQFERPADQSDAAKNRRAGYGTNIYNAVAVTTATTSTAKATKTVTVTAKSGLNVRSGPGTSYKKVTALVYGKTVTVYSDMENGWYALADGSGYIYGKYVK